MEEKSDSVVCVRLSFGPTLRSCPASPTGPDCIPANRGPGQQPPEDSVHGSVHFDDPPTNADERGIPAFVSIHHGTHSPRVEIKRQRVTEWQAVADRWATQAEHCRGFLGWFRRAS